MKLCTMAIAIFTVLAVPGLAFAGQWHCAAQPVGDPFHPPHEGDGPTEADAAAEAIQGCEIDHPFCKIVDCHYDP